MSAREPTIPMSRIQYPMTRTPKSSTHLSNPRDATANVMAHSDPKMKATLLNNQFSSVFTEKYLSRLPSMDGEPFPDMHGFSVTTEGVRELLLNLYPHKATGPDSISLRFLKDHTDCTAPVLTLIFQA